MNRATPSCPVESSESFGRLFKNDLRIYVYPLRRTAADELQTVDTIEVDAGLRPLYDYLAMRGSFVPLDNYHDRIPRAFSVATF